MVLKRYPQFILFGDSIIQYSTHLKDGFSFGAALEEHCQRRLDIINRGLSGYNTANALKILSEVIPHPSSAKVDYLLVGFGANDAVLPGYSGQHVPLQNYRENVQTIITYALKAEISTILLVTPPPIDEITCEMEDKKKGYENVIRDPNVTAAYAQAIREIAAESGGQVILIDLWTAIMREAISLTPGFIEGGGLLGSREKGVTGGLKNLLVDGLHFTGAGYKVFFDEIVPEVGKTWEGEPFDNPAWYFPHWSVAPKIE